MAETSIEKLEAEIEQLDRLVWTLVISVSYTTHNCTAPKRKSSRRRRNSRTMGKREWLITSWIVGCFSMSQVRQREEDTRSTKMMLRFREDKIQRMESLLGGSLAAESYLLDENKALSEEIRLLQAKVDRNPEVTRFARENIRLLDQLER